MVDRTRVLAKRKPAFFLGYFLRVASGQGIGEYSPQRNSLREPGWQKSLTPKHQATGDHVVQRLFSLRETGHDVADAQGNHAGDDLRKVAARSAAKCDGVPRQIGDIESQRLFAPCGLLLPAFKVRVIEPLNKDGDGREDEDHPYEADDHGGIR